jgi:hypothetical protein
LRAPLPCVLVASNLLVRLLFCGPILNAISSYKPSLAFQEKKKPVIDHGACSQTQVSLGTLHVSFEAHFHSV